MRVQAPPWAHKKSPRRRGGVILLMCVPRAGLESRSAPERSGGLRRASQRGEGASRGRGYLGFWIRRANSKNLVTRDQVPPLIKILSVLYSQIVLLGRYSRRERLHPFSVLLHSPRHVGTLRLRSARRRWSARVRSRRALGHGPRGNSRCLLRRGALRRRGPRRAGARSEERRVGK